MSLPNSGMNFTPFDPLLASEMNDLVDNIESLSDGSGIQELAINPTKLGDTIFAEAVVSGGSLSNANIAKLNISSVAEDPYGMISTGNNQATIPRSGVYSISAGWRGAVGTNNRMQIRIRLNNNSSLDLSTSDQRTSGTMTATTAVNGVRLAQGDIISVIGYQNSGSSVSPVSGARETRLRIVYHGSA